MNSADLRIERKRSLVIHPLHEHFEALPAAFFAASGRALFK